MHSTFRPFSSHLNALWYGTRDMSTQRSSIDLDLDHAFRSITGMIAIIESKSASRIASKPPFLFCNTETDLTDSQRQQFRINSALSVIAIRDVEVVTVLSSVEKTADASSTYVVAVNPRSPSDHRNKNLLRDDVLLYQTTDHDDDDALPQLVLGEAEDLSGQDFPNL
jgi:hypothetical protein